MESLNGVFSFRTMSVESVDFVSSKQRACYVIFTTNLVGNEEFLFIAKPAHPNVFVGGFNKVGTGFNNARFDNTTGFVPWSDMSFSPDGGFNAAAGVQLQTLGKKKRFPVSFVVINFSFDLLDDVKAVISIVLEDVI